MNTLCLSVGALKRILSSHAEAISMLQSLNKLTALKEGLRKIILNDYHQRMRDLCIVFSYKLC